MTKLDDNNRWAGKMLLTEHQEQYQNRQNKPLTGRVTTEEIKLVRDSVLLPYALTMIQKSLDELKGSKITLHQIMAQFMLLVMDKTSAELYRVKRELKKRSIRVLSDETHDDIVYNKYVCRGYEEKFGMTREVMRSGISEHLSRAYKAIINPTPNLDKE
jgi:hypothetical protein